MTLPGKKREAATSRNGVIDHRSHHYRFRLNDAENDRFLSMFEQSGAATKTKFILARIFG